MSSRDRADWDQRIREYAKDSESIFKNLDAADALAKRALDDIAKTRERIEESRRKTPDYR